MGDWHTACQPSFARWPTETIWAEFEIENCVTMTRQTHNTFVDRLRSNDANGWHQSPLLVPDNPSSDVMKLNHLTSDSIDTASRLSTARSPHRGVARSVQIPMLLLIGIVSLFLTDPARAASQPRIPLA